MSTTTAPMMPVFQKLRADRLAVPYTSESTQEAILSAGRQALFGRILRMMGESLCKAMDRRAAALTRRSTQPAALPW
jgi:hypothetical protein